MDSIVVEVNQFRKVYGDVVAVDGISFDVREGEIFGLLGPNGAGKTSTLESLEGLRQPDGGLLRIKGIDPAKEPAKLREIIGVQLQAASLPETMTPEEAMQFFCSYHGIPARLDLLERLGLQQKRTSQYSQLSAGQQRRLTLALAVAHSPQVLLLDEPTAGLDVESRVELHRLIRELQAKGTAIVLATHDMAEAEALTDRIAILLNGKLAAIGTPMEVTATGAGLTKISVRTEGGTLLETRPEFPAVSQLLVKQDFLILFSAHIGRTIPALIAHIESIDDSLVDLRVERPSLEDRFVEITKHGSVQ